MKPYITDALKNGKYHLEYQIEGADRKYIGKVIQGASVVAYSHPIKQTLACTWELYIHFKEGFSLKFSSATTGIGGWEELGSLNIDFINESVWSASCLGLNAYVAENVDHFVVNKIERLVYNAKDVFSECGLVFFDVEGCEIVIAAGISPGSVSAKFPHVDNVYESELKEEDYTRSAWQCS